MFVINNQLSKSFARKGLRVVVALVRARGRKHAWLWRGIECAWFLWYYKNEDPVLIYGILSFGLQSRCLTKFHGPLILHLKRVIMIDPIVSWLWLRTMHLVLAGRGSNSVEGDDDRSSAQKWRISSESYSSKVADLDISKRMGSDDMNGDPCIISSSGFCSGKCFTMESFKQVVAMAELVSPSFSSRLPWDVRSFQVGSLREEQNQGYWRCGSLDWHQFFLLWSTQHLQPPTFNDVSQGTTFEELAIWS